MSSSPGAGVENELSAQFGAVSIFQVTLAPAGFRASWGKACAKAGIVGVGFNDLRGTTVTRLALVGCTEADVNRALDRAAQASLTPQAG